MEIMEITTLNTPSIRPANFLPRPTDRMGTTLRTLRGITLKDKKGVLGFMTSLLNSDKRPEITMPHDLVRLTHVCFDSSTRQYISLPKDRQQLLHDRGISKSNQKRICLLSWRSSSFIKTAWRCLGQDGPCPHPRKLLISTHSRHGTSRPPGVTKKVCEWPNSRASGSSAYGATAAEHGRR